MNFVPRQPSTAAATLSIPTKYPAKELCENPELLIVPGAFALGMGKVSLPENQK
jgi:hypothetical protein